MVLLFLTGFFRINCCFSNKSVLFGFEKIQKPIFTLECENCKVYEKNLFTKTGLSYMILMNPSIENKGYCLPVHLPITGMLKHSFINKYAKGL